MATEKTQRLLASLERAVLDVQDSNSFKAYLRMTAKFHTYSFGNVLLIAAQRPDATRVAGYRTWHALGRYVRRGEKGIAIVVPYRSMQENDAGEIVERVWFGTGYVFDISQTDGEELPNIECPVLTGDGATDLYQALAAVATGEGFKIDRSERPGEEAAGFWQPATRTIWIAPGPTERPGDEDPRPRAGARVRPGERRLRGVPRRARGRGRSGGFRCLRTQRTRHQQAQRAVHRRLVEGRRHPEEGPLEGAEYRAPDHR